MLEIKVTLSADQSLINLFTALAGGLALSRPSSEVQKKEPIKTVSKKIDSDEPLELVKSEPVLKTAEDSADVIDYEVIRANIKRLGSEKKVAGKDTVAVMKKYGGKLSKVPNEQLLDLQRDLEEL